MIIEPLESRIAPAQILSPFTDVDGDLVNITLSKFGGVTLVRHDAGIGRQLDALDLNGDTDYTGATITITATPQVIGGVLRGDGHVDVGFIDADGISLVAVTVDGDLGKLLAGPFGVDGVTLKSLTVGSLGARGLDTGAPDFQTIVTGGIGTVKIAGDLRGYLYSTQGIGSVSVGGGVIGGFGISQGGIYTLGDLGPVTVKGNVVGAFGDYSGAIGAARKTGKVTIGGSLFGGTGDNSGTIFSGYLTPSDMGAIKIGRDVVGGEFSVGEDGTNSGTIVSTGAIASVTIGGSLRGNKGIDSGRIEAAGDIGAVQIGGSVLGESGGEKGGRIQAFNKMIKSVKIGGSLVGGDELSAGKIFAFQIPNLSIGGDLAGGLGFGSGGIDVNVLGTVSIGGSIRGASDPNPSDNLARGSNSGQISADSITKLTVGGSLEGTNADFTGRIEVGGALGIGSLTVGGDLRGGFGEASGKIDVSGKIGTAAIRGSIIGGAGFNSGSFQGDLGITKVTVGGSVLGGQEASRSGVITSESGLLGSVSIAGDLVGGDGPVNSSPTNTDSGAILAQRIGSVTIGGSIFAGSNAMARSGAIVATEDIGAIVVRGSIVGRDPTDLVEIYARGLAGDPTANNIAIKSLTVGGSVESARIFAGVNTSGGLVGGNAQIGKVSVGGDWIASSMAAGAGSGNNFIGDADDFTIGSAGKIASVVIAGKVLGRAGTTETFGIFAREIGSFKYGGVALALTKGAGTDTFALSKAQAVGPSLSPVTALKPDGFAVHVFEV